MAKTDGVKPDHEIEIEEIRKLLTQLKKGLEGADLERRFAVQAFDNATTGLAHIRQQLAAMVNTLEAYAAPAEAVGPSETKRETDSK